MENKNEVTVYSVMYSSVELVVPNWGTTPIKPKMDNPDLGRHK